MDEMNNGQSNGREAGSQDMAAQAEEAWESFQVGLEGYVARLTDEGDHLVVELPSGGGGTAPYAQFAGLGEGRVRAELSGNAHLAPAHRLDAERTSSLTLGGWKGNDEVERNWYVERVCVDANVIATSAVWALREVFGIAHPLLMTYRAWGANAASAAALGLAATEEMVVESPIDEDDDSREPVVLTPSSRDELIEMVRAVLAVKFGEKPEVDDDGDVVLMQLGQPTWVRVRHEQPAIEIFTLVARDVRSRRATAVELGVLNRDYPWVKWIQQDRTVWQHLFLMGAPLLPDYLGAMVDVFFGTFSKTRDDLVFRVMGKAA